ncbi:hypothetical protein LLH23_15670 [bacterium]|nr:hypothetical protein [bacterium]
MPSFRVLLLAWAIVCLLAVFVACRHAAAMPITPAMSYGPSVGASAPAPSPVTHVAPALAPEPIIPSPG